MCIHTASTDAPAALLRGIVRGFLPGKNILNKKNKKCIHRASTDAPAALLRGIVRGFLPGKNILNK